MGVNNRRSKGISPLIAAVLLIAFTMAIAGIMATWATTFSKERLETARIGAECIDALDISSLSFSNGTITAKIRNRGEINLTGLTANVEYSDASKSKLHQNLRLANYNFSDPLAPGATDFFIYNSNDQTKPQKLEVIAGNCGDFPVSLLFR